MYFSFNNGFTFTLQNCKDNFTGDNCNKCKEGFYLQDDKCVRCACPSTDASESHSSTCKSDYSGGFVCDNCEIGYTGKYCEQ